MNDLVVLVADGNLEHAIKGILGRPEAIGVRKLSHKIFKHVERDPGCFNQSDTFLRNFLSQAKYCLVIFDLEGCGQENLGRNDIEKKVKEKLEINGWKDRCEVIVIDPELEQWIWSESPNLAQCLGWNQEDKKLRDWLEEKEFWDAGKDKPSLPKEALEFTLRTTQTPRSSSIYEKVAKKVSLKKCKDESYIKLIDTLRSWFPVNPTS